MIITKKELTEWDKMVIEKNNKFEETVHFQQYLKEKMVEYNFTLIRTYFEKSNVILYHIKQFGVDEDRLIKIVKCATEEDYEYAKSQAEKLMQVKHRNIIQVFHLYKWNMDKTIFHVELQEYFEKSTPLAKIRKDQIMSREIYERLDLANQLYLGLRCIHSSFHTHNDLHAGNILIHNTENILKIIDPGNSYLKDSDNKIYSDFGFLKNNILFFFSENDYLPAFESVKDLEQIGIKLQNIIQQRDSSKICTIDANHDGTNISFDVYNKSDNSIILGIIGVVMDNGDEIDIQYYENTGAPKVLPHNDFPNQYFSLRKFRNAFVDCGIFDTEKSNPTYILNKHIEGNIIQMYIKERSRDKTPKRVFYSKNFIDPINMTEITKEAKVNYENFVKTSIHNNHERNIKQIEHFRKNGHFGGTQLMNEITEEEFRKKYPFI